MDKIIQTFDGMFILSKYTLLEGGQAKTIQYIKVFTKIFPEGKLFKIWIFLEGRMFLIDENKKLWIYYIIPKLKKVCGTCKYFDDSHKKSKFLYCKTIFLIVMKDDHCSKWKSKRKKYLLSPPCQVHCSKNPRRWHLTYFWCRKRRIMEGKVDNPVKVDLYIDIVHKDIKICRLRQYLIKNLRSLIELIGGL